ncbi:MAG: hypothetical protein LBU06_06655 [Desulfovibrio sp.]|jgi:hypothetical protein|nr:hypothetical protein [Desulfovibrio sp.]
MKKNLVFLCVCLMASWFIAACSKKPPDLERPGIFSGYGSSCQLNLYQGRAYVAQGRLELAKEHLLLALAQSGDAETRRVVADELKGVEMSILTLR